LELDLEEGFPFFTGFEDLEVERLVLALLTGCFLADLRLERSPEDLFSSPAKRSLGTLPFLLTI